MKQRDVFRDARGMGVSRHLPVMLYVTLTLIAVGLAIFRSLKVQQVLTGVAACDNCFFWQALRSDLWLVAGLSLLAALALWVRSLGLRLIATLMLLALIIAMIADVIVFNSLAMRLQIGDIGKFGTEWSAINRFLMVYSHGLWPWLLALVVASVVTVLWVALRVRSRHGRSSLGLVLLSVFALVSANIHGAGQQQYVHDTEVRNWLMVNWDQGVAQPYSDAFIARLQQLETHANPVCKAGDGRRPNIILLVVESLSAYQSELLGGRGWTPNIDAVAKQGAWFTQFHANGFTTDHGLIALLTGRDPLPAVGRYGSSKAYDGFESPQGSLPTMLHDVGYSTSFFTTGDLRFLDKGTWCKQIGFDHVEGAEQPFYDGMPRLHFNAAPDEALFSRFMAWYGERPKAQPFFATLLTVSSHPPFLDPEQKTRSEEAVIRYVDRQIGVFYEDLKQAGFFDNGLLLVVGDHRAMTPVTASETEAYGERALSRIPFLVLGQGGLKPGPQSVLGQQVDLKSSLAALVGTTVCRPPQGGVFLGETVQPPRYIIHVRGDKRSWLSVYLPAGDAVVHMDGDHTRWEGHVPSNGDGILADINRQRVSLGVAHQDAVDYVIQLKEGKRAF